MSRALGRACLAIAILVAGARVPYAKQPSASQSDIERDIAEADRLRKERKIDEATKAYRAIIDAARARGLEADEANAQCGLGETLNAHGQYPDAQTALQRCLDLAERSHDDRQTARALLTLSQHAELTGRMSDAAAFADRAVALYETLDNPGGRGHARLQRLRVGKPSDADEETLVPQIIDDARLAGDRELEAAAVHLRGDGLFNAARYEEALDWLTRARDLYHAVERYSDEGTVYNSIGRVYRAHGRLDEALKSQLQALALHEQYGEPFELMQSLNAVGVVHTWLGNLSAARDYFERALAVAKTSSSPRIQDFLNANIAGLLVEQGEYEKAARTLEEVIAHGFDSYPSLRYSSLADAYLGLHRPADALTAAQKGLDSCRDVQETCLIALENRAAAYSALNDDAAARADIRKALDTLEGLRARLVPADFLKQNFHEVQQRIYSAAIAIAFNRHDDRESLETAELASSRAFLDLLAARAESPAGARPDAALTVRGAPAAGDLPSAATAAPATADDLAAIASRLHSTAVVYWPADDALFIWVVIPGGHIVSRRVEISSARIVELIGSTATADRAPQNGARSAMRAVTTRGATQLFADPAGKRAWRQLYDVLIAPVRSELPRTPGALLTIVPHGVLTNLSFAALQNHDGRYLLEDYAMHYAPAGAVLQFTAGMRRADARSGAALLVADPATVRRSPLDPQLPPLPGARQEVAEIAGVMPRGRVTRLEGREATEPRVTAAAADKAIVHFATHAIVRDDAPNDSYLAFGPGGSSTTGLLTARQVYDLRLKADLVVLSACRSGGGRVTGDGVATFARAFLYAGTPSLVVSLWDVADEPTSRLLPPFYRTWLAGASKARSLRRAQLRLLADLRAGAVRVETRAGPIVLPEHPLFWAGFVLIGEPE